MTDNWWVCDLSGHRRGPFSISQLSLLLDVVSVNHLSAVCANGEQRWSTIESSESVTNALAAFISSGTPVPKSNRLPLSAIPPTESIICSDPTCPKAPSCDVVYIWDRQQEMYLTYDEYVQVCTNDGLTDGLPDRALAQTAEQVQALLIETDNRPRKQTRQHPDEENDIPLSDPEKEAKRQKKRAYRERKKLKRDAGLWIKAKTNPNIYISGLPLDISVGEISEIFSKAGQVKNDIQTGRPRIRIYGHGDALVTYMHAESVQLAISRYHESEVRPGFVISVQQADFGIESSAVPGADLSIDELKERAQVNREKRKKLLEFYRKEKELKSAWDVAEHATVKRRPIVVFTHCFDPISDRRPIDYDFIIYCVEKISRKFGTIKKITPIHDSIDGYVCVRYQTIEMAEACLALFDAALESGDVVEVIEGKNVTAFMHDGRDLSSRIYSPPVDAQTVSQQESRMEELDHQMERAIEWEEFLYEEADSDDDEIQIRTE